MPPRPARPSLLRAAAACLAIVVAVGVVAVALPSTLRAPAARGPARTDGPSPAISPKPSASSRASGAGRAATAGRARTTPVHAIPAPPCGAASASASLGAGGGPAASPSPATLPGGADVAASASPAGSPGSSGSPPADAAGTASAWRDPSLVEHVPVLMYHRVVPQSEAGDSLPSLIVSPQLFAAQMAALHDTGWHAVTFAHLAADLAAGVSEPARTLVITFDDGYRDGYRYVLPVFRQFGYVGTFFVITDRVGRAAFFSASELCAMTHAGDEIGNHTVHHVGLGIVPPATAAAEIEDAARAIRSWTGVSPVTLAYPYGNWSPAVLGILAADGYDLAATTVYGAAQSYPGRFLVPRVRVGPGTTPDDLLAALAPYAGW